MVIILLTKYRLAWLILKFPTACTARLKEEVAVLIAALLAVFRYSQSCFLS